MVLGIVYNKRNDNISINPSAVQESDVTIVTKRVILATMHKVFDPIGFTSPVRILPKLLLKRLRGGKRTGTRRLMMKHAKNFYYGKIS